MEKEYQVEVIHRQRCIYRVLAKDREEAERIAAERWRRGNPSDFPGYEWSDLVSTTAYAAPDPARLEQDVEVVYRFLQAREQLIQQLGGDPFNPGANDAISASQVASDLGWVRVEPGRPRVPDVPRSTAALEKLCQMRRLVCFARTRMRGMERGEIRLYCTPDYLERLSSDLTAVQTQRA